MGFFGDRRGMSPPERGPAAVRSGIRPAIRNRFAGGGDACRHLPIGSADRLHSLFEVCPDCVAFTVQAHLRDHVEDQFEEIPRTLVDLAGA